MEAENILVVDDDQEIRELIRILLESEGYQVSEAESGPQAMELLNEKMDLVILDVMMPGVSGYQVCRQIRERNNVPILFLTAKSQDSDRIMGLSSGGDDFLSKPFSSGELLARVKALLRRYRIYQGKPRMHTEKYLIHGDVKINTAVNEVFLRGQEIDLTETEYQLLLLMVRYPGKIFSAQNLYESVWQEPYFSISANNVMVHIRRLRSKLERDPQNPEIIRTVWGKGYRIE